MRITIIIILFIYSCKPNEKGSITKSYRKFELPAGHDSLEYVNYQKESRQYLLKSYLDSTNMTLRKKIKNGQIVINFKETCISDTNFIVPARFNLDTKQDFIAHNFKSIFQSIKLNDTLFTLNITKDLFSDLLDSNLIKYGALKSLDGYANEMTLTETDSFHIYFEIRIPATLYSQMVVLAGNYKGKYVTYKFNLPKGVTM